jgi:hypothetical protein
MPEQALPEMKVSTETTTTRSIELSDLEISAIIESWMLETYGIDVGEAEVSVDFHIGYGEILTGATVRTTQTERS